MIIDILTLCDNAQQYQGKLVIVGTFNKVTMNKFPNKIPVMTFIARIGMNIEENGNHKFRFTVNKHGDTQDIVPQITGNIDTTKNSFDFSYSNFILNLNNIMIPSEGIYDFILNIDGKDYIYKLFVVEDK